MAKEDLELTIEGKEKLEAELDEWNHLNLIKLVSMLSKRVNPGWVNQDMAHYMKSMTKK